MSGRTAAVTTAAAARAEAGTRAEVVVAMTGVATVLTAVATRAAAAVATPVVATRAAAAVAIVPIVAGTKVATIAAAVDGTPKPFGTGAGVPARPRLSRTSQ